MNQKKITIFGSCVTREAFNMPLLNNDKFIIELYLQGNLFTMFDKSLDIEEKYACGDSDFLKRMVYYDFNKLIVPKFENNISDYLIVDFAEVRPAIIKLYKQGFETTLSQKFQVQETIKGLTLDNKLDGFNIVNGEKPYWYNIDKVKEYVEKFVDLVIKKYKKENIILIVPRNCFLYETEEKIFHEYDDYQRLIMENEFMELVSNMFYNKMNNEIIKINIPSDVTGDRNHYLGINPLHYEKTCYEYLSNCLYLSLTKNAKQDEIDKLYYEYYDKLKIEKRKTYIRYSLAKEKQKNKV